MDPTTKTTPNYWQVPWIKKSGPDTFWTFFGKLVALSSFLFLLVCAVLFLVLCADTYRDLDQPTFTIAPDTAKKAK